VRIIQRAETIDEHQYDWVFQRIGATEGTGYAFDTDEDGDLLPLEPEAVNSLDYVLAHPEEYEDRGIEHRVWQRKVYTQGICDVCGEVVELSGFTNPCDCGADYNFAGQRLAPRNQWGEETGEHPSDIARIP
jgi:hypothetical protein